MLKKPFLTVIALTGPLNKENMVKEQMLNLRLLIPNISLTKKDSLG